MPKAKDKTPKPDRNRRLSLSEPSNETSAKQSKSKEKKSSKSSPSKSGGKDDILSKENLISSKKILEEIQQYRREAEKWMNCEDEIASDNPTYQTKQKHQNQQTSPTDQDSDASTSENVKTSVVKLTVVADVHQTEFKQETGTKKRLRNRTVSHESVVNYEEHQQPKNTENSKTLSTLERNLKLISLSRPINQASEERKVRARAASLPGHSRSDFLPPSTYITLIPYLCNSQDYECITPPPPAPPDPPLRNQYEIDRDYSNNFVLPLPIDPPVEPVWHVEPNLAEFVPYGRRVQSDPHIEIPPAEFRPTRAHSAHNSPSRLAFMRYRNQIRVPFDNAYDGRRDNYYRGNCTSVVSYLSPARRWQHASRLEVLYPDGFSYIPEAPYRAVVRIPENAIQNNYEAAAGHRRNSDPNRLPQQQETRSVSLPRNLPYIS